MSHKCHHGTIYSLQIRRQNESQRILSFVQLLCFLFCAVNVAYGKALPHSQRSVSDGKVSVGDGHR